MSAVDLGRSFGDEFAKSVIALASGAWEGPVRSAFGLHLVRIAERVEARMPDLAEAREEVRRDVVTKRREEADRLLYEKLRGMYRVVVDDAAIEAATR